ncbi:MAG: PP0621 family protein [Methylotenera sp.]
MWRLIFLGLIIWLIVYMLKRSFLQSNKTPSNEDNTPNDSSELKDKVEDMVQCAHCAVHLPRSEAFLVNGKLYCSKAHIQHK